MYLGSGWDVWFLRHHRYNVGALSFLDHGYEGVKKKLWTEQGTVTHNNQRETSAAKKSSFHIAVTVQKKIIKISGFHLIKQNFS